MCHGVYLCVWCVLDGLCVMMCVLDGLCVMCVQMGCVSWCVHDGLCVMVCT